MLTSASVSSEPVVAIPSPSIPSVLWGTVSRLRNAILRPFTLPFIFFIMAYKFFWVWLEKRRRGTLHGKVVLVTGASSGLGKSIARKFYHLGSRVILSARNKAELEEFRAELLAGQQGSTTFPPVVLPMDLQDVNSIEALVQNVLRLNSGRVDILINCGGIGYRGTIADTALDVDIRLMLVNYFGHVALTRALLPSMRSARSGHIVFIGSVQGKMAIPQRSSYSASKHALGAFCDCLRAEVAADGIQVSLVAPSYIKTNFSRNAVTGEGDRHGGDYEDMLPRVCDAGEIYSLGTGSCIPSFKLLGTPEILFELFLGLDWDSVSLMSWEGKYLTIGNSRDRETTVVCTSETVYSLETGDCMQKPNIDQDEQEKICGLGMVFDMKTLNCKEKQETPCTVDCSSSVIENACPMGEVFDLEFLRCVAAGDRDNECFSLSCEEDGGTFDAVISQFGESTKLVKPINWSEVRSVNPFDDELLNTTMNNTATGITMEQTTVGTTFSDIEELTSTPTVTTEESTSESPRTGSTRSAAETSTYFAQTTSLSTTSKGPDSFEKTSYRLKTERDFNELTVNGTRKEDLLRTLEQQFQENLKIDVKVTGVFKGSTIIEVVPQNPKALSTLADLVESGDLALVDSNGKPIGEFSPKLGSASDFPTQEEKEGKNADKQTYIILGGLLAGFAFLTAILCGVILYKNSKKNAVESSAAPTVVVAYPFTKGAFPPPKVDLTYEEIYGSSGMGGVINRTVPIPPEDSVPNFGTEEEIYIHRRLQNEMDSMTFHHLNHDQRVEEQARYSPHHVPEDN
ncbi:unnamed protein product [Cyprideis torosa]|uniref:Ketoreductase domain-containing protein n=1 Tax=Cyprideis torosa TaxID=163714 RepID=A0A7R8WL79_9CRUS|nr:unnamed protein product [Cyprideis torosa]CAG0897716.1 unnamed protein product [Cyprideis torosa]